MPHRFVAVDDVAVLAAGGLGDHVESGVQAAVLAATADAQRGRCRLPGCGKPADDPIHV
jgi:hypothetical protein